MGKCNANNVYGIVCIGVKHWCNEFHKYQQLLLITSETLYTFGSIHIIQMKLTSDEERPSTPHTLSLNHISECYFVFTTSLMYIST